MRIWEKIKKRKLEDSIENKIGMKWGKEQILGLKVRGKVSWYS